MAYSFTIGGVPTQVSATELVVSNLDSIEAGFYDVQYPEILWKTVISQESIVTDMNPGALNYVYRSRDWKGMGQFTRGDSKNIPRVGQVVGQVTVPVLDAAVGAGLTDIEAMRYQFGFQQSLSQDYGEIMKKATEYHMERVTFFGDTAANFNAWLDYPSITKIAITAWTGGTPDEWVTSINDAITTVWTNSKTIHLPDTVWLPPAKYSMLTQAYVIGTGSVGVAVSALEYLKKNNIYTAQTGKELNVKVLRYLEGAGVAGVDRMVIQDSNPRNYVLPFPLPYQLGQPVPVALGVELFALYIFGSFNVRYPLAMAYGDGL